jgi:nitrogen regulatory protein P-II 2
MTLLTIICEALLKEKILDLVRSKGASGFSVANVIGEGSRGNHSAEWEGPSARIETIVQLETADTILEELSAGYFENYSVIAWKAEVEVLRVGKFNSP